MKQSVSGVALPRVGGGVHWAACRPWLGVRGVRAAVRAATPWAAGRPAPITGGPVSGPAAGHQPVLAGASLTVADDVHRRLGRHPERPPGEPGVAPGDRLRPAQLTRHLDTHENQSQAPKPLASARPGTLGTAHTSPAGGRSLPAHRHGGGGGTARTATYRDRGHSHQPRPDRLTKPVAPSVPKSDQLSRQLHFDRCSRASPRIRNSPSLPIRWAEGRQPLHWRPPCRAGRRRPRPAPPRPPVARRIDR